MKAIINNEPKKVVGSNIASRLIRRCDDVGRLICDAGAVRVAHWHSGVLDLCPPVEDTAEDPGKHFRFQS